MSVDVHYEVTIPHDKIFNSGYKTAILSYREEAAIAIFEQLRSLSAGTTDYYLLPMLREDDDWDYPSRVLYERVLMEVKVLIVDWPTDDEANGSSIAIQMLKHMTEASKEGCLIRVADIKVTPIHQEKKVVKIDDILAGEGAEET